MGILATVKDWAARYSAPEGCRIDVAELDVTPADLQPFAGSGPGVLFSLEAPGAVHKLQMWLPLAGGKGVVAVTAGAGPVAAPELTEWEAIMVDGGPHDPPVDPITLTGSEALELALSWVARDFCRDYIFGPAIKAWLASKGVECGEGAFDFPDLELLERHVKENWCVLQFDSANTSYPACDMVAVSGCGEAAFLMAHRDKDADEDFWSFLDPPVKVRSVGELEKWLAEKTGL